MADLQTNAREPSLAANVVRIAIPVAALVALFAGGAWTYTHIVGSLLFQAQSVQVLPTKLILALAVLAGAASFFSPCSLVITPAFLAYFVDKDTREGNSASGKRIFRASLLIGAGIVTISIVAGLLVGAVGAIVYNFLIYMVPVVGAIFLALGAVILLGRTGGLAWAPHHMPGHHAYQRMLDENKGSTSGELFAFGVAYGAASHSCTLPVVIGMIMLPIAAGNYWLAGIAMLIYGLALAGLMLLMLTLGQPAVTAMRRSIGPYLQYLIGVLFIATGGYLFHYFLINFGFEFAF